jgi:hypothetical protein
LPSLAAGPTCLPSFLARDADWLWRNTNGGDVGISAAGIKGPLEYPNTNGYQFGIVTQSFIKISNIKKVAGSPTSYQFDYVKEAPAGTCAAVDCNQGMPGMALA